MTSTEGDSTHNTSQDSGLGPSPFLHQNGFPRSSPAASQNGAGPRPSTVSPPPPLPPKKRTSPAPSNVFSPTLMVKSPSYGNYYNSNPVTDQANHFHPQQQPRVSSMEFIRTQDFIPPPMMSSAPSSQNSSIVDHTNPRSSLKKQQHRHRIEAHRNSILIFSSDEEEDVLHHTRIANQEQVMNEPFPPELDFAQVTGHSEFRPHMPPPPPPRDPKRRLYLSGSPVCQVHHRPVSYSFEKPDVVQTRTPVQARPRSSSAFVAQAHVYPSHRVLETPPPLRSRSVANDSKLGRGGSRAASASSYFRYSVPDLVQPQMEYWKSPPPPFVPTFDPNLTREEENDMPPPRPPRPNLRKKLSNTSNDSRGRDSAIGLSHGPSPVSHHHHHGKSSPSSSSVASKDSGIPETTTAISTASILPHQMPGGAVLDTTTQNGTTHYQNNYVKEPSTEDILTTATEEEVEVIECSDNEEEESTESFSPPRTNENHPGFSSKTRRSLFRAAINEIEDVFKQLQADTDLLDRAERRDLPTAHQELIAQSRSNTSLNTDTENMLFSDMDNFMNWNTSSSFENIPEGRQRTPSARRSGVPDKTKDDMVYRICRDNNKVHSGQDPGVKLNQSYLLLSPAMTPASSMANVPSLDYYGNLGKDKILTRVMICD